MEFSDDRQARYVRVENVGESVAAFSEARDWSQFHSPKNLAMALAGEVGELNSLLQWVSSEDVETWLADPEHREALASEMADVQTYLILLAQRTGIDLDDAVRHKLRVNEERYPATKSHGNSSKYTEL